MTDEQFNAFLTTVKPIPKKNTPAIIVDIDGTVARSGKRKPHQIENILEDEVIYYTLSTAYEWVKGCTREKRKILFVTGRSEPAREQTELWIDKKAFGFDREYYKLYMRPTIMTNLSGPEYKYATYRDYIHDEFDVKFVMENSLRACRMYRALGLDVMHIMSAQKPGSEEE